MHLRNGRHGHGLVTEVLHWSTVAADLGQFVVGNRMDLYGCPHVTAQILFLGAIA